MNFEVIKKNILDADEAPRGKGIFYHCIECDEYIPSLPQDNIGCSCGNIFIDFDYFRLAVRNYSQFEVVKKVTD